MSDLRQNKDADRGAKLPGASSRMLCFSVGDSQFALPLLDVREVIAFVDPTPVPETSDYFRGIVNLRGRVISVLDLRRRLKMGAGQKGLESSIIVLELIGLSVGVIVDSVNSVQAVAASEICDAEEICDAGPREFVRQVIKKDKSMIFVLDVEGAVGASELKNLKNRAA